MPRLIHGLCRSACSGEELDQLSLRRQAGVCRAARSLAASLTELAGDDVVTRLLGGRQAVLPAPFEHRPADDLTDAQSGYQYFLHRHEAPRGEWAHLHLFKRWYAQALGTSVTTHLVGLSLTRHGRPRGWFCVNRWVTDEFWQPWPQTVRWLQQFHIDDGGIGNHPSLQPVHRWLRALIRLHEPDLKQLLQQRDALQANWVGDEAGGNVFEDRRLDVIGFCAIDLPARLRWCRQRRRFNVNI